MNKLELTLFPALDYACREAINTLCTNLTFAGSEVRCVMLTSCQSQEGKSFLSLCIQRTLSLLGYRVVLIDADLRGSCMGARYGMRQHAGKGQGLAHYLAGMCPLEDVLYATDVPGADMIPVGYAVTDSLALLSSARFSCLLHQLRMQYDYVLVDAPPIGAIIDAAQIAKACDGTILVVKYNKVSRRALSDAKAQIERTGCRMLGTVINAAEFDTIRKSPYYDTPYYSNYSAKDKR